MSKNIWALLLWVLIVPTVSGQYIVKGKLTDPENKEPIQGASVWLDSNRIAAITNELGMFELNAPDSVLTVTISSIGYQDQQFRLKAGETAVIALEPSVETMQTVVITANRDASLRTETPIAISKLSSKLIEETKSSQMVEVLNKAPGVLMVNLGNEQHSMAIRQPMTTSAYYLYLEDGIPIRPMGVFNHNALLEINQFALSSIEVVKGPVSSIYGPEAVGGAVNFFTQRPTSVPTAKLGLQANQYGYGRIQFGAGTRVKKFGIYASGLVSQQNNGWMTASDYDKSIVNTRLEYHLSNKMRLVGTFMFNKYYSQMSGSVDSIAFYNREYVSTSDFTYRKSDVTRSRLTLEKDWNSGAQTQVTLFNRTNKLGQNPSYAIRWTTGQTTARGEINSNDFESYGLLLQHVQKLKFMESKLISGALFDLSPNRYNSYQIDLIAQLRPGGASVEKYTISQERPDIKLADYDALIRNIAAYAQYDFKPLKKMRISAGMRFDQMYFTYENFLDNSSGSKEYHNFTPKLGLTYELSRGKGLYANVSQGFSPPALTAIFRKRPNTNPAEFYYNLEPARFFNYELGGWASFWENKIYVDATAYQMEGRNELLNIRQPDNSFDYQSAGKTLHRGVELGLTFKPTKQYFWRWGGTIALHRFEDFQISNRVTDTYQNLAGFEMPSAPRWTWNTEFYYYPTWLPNLRTSLEWQFVSGFYQNQINTVRAEGYHVLNYRIAYKWKNIEVYVNVLNASNALYAANVSRGNNATDRSNFTPAPPRTFVGGIQYNLAGKK